MKLCDLTQFYSPDSGGVKRYLHEKIDYIQRATDYEHVLIVPGAKDGCVVNGRCKVYTIRSPRFSSTSRYRVMLRVGQLKEILEKEHPDLIELGDPYHVSWAAIKYAKRLHIPVVGFYHSNFPEAYVRTFSKFLGNNLGQSLERYAENYVCRLYNQMSRTLVPSPGLDRLLRLWGVNNTVEVALGVDTEIFSPAQRDRSWLCEEHHVPDDKNILLYVTRLSQEKNVSTLLRAFELLQSSGTTAGLNLPPPPQTQIASEGRFKSIIKNAPIGGSGFHLIIVGDGPLRKEVNETIRRTKAVTWLHYISDKHMLAKIYASVDIFVHPGVLETFVFAALESQSCGVPVVGIRGSRLDKIIFAGQHYWAPKNNPADLAFAIESISRTDLRVLGAQARAQLVEKYSWDAVFAHLFSIYRETAPL